MLVLSKDAVRQFNRHRRTTPIRLIGVEPDSHHYTGIFNAADAESFAALLELEPDLVIEKRVGEIVIRARQEGAQSRRKQGRRSIQTD